MSSMLPGLLVLIAVAGVPTDEATSLVARLGSTRYLDREAASTALERLGRAAIPALRSAREHHDLEIRNRSIALLGRIEGRLLLEPTLVALDYREAPLSEVVRSIARKAELNLTLANDLLPGADQRRITLQSPEPIPFWQVVDRLCAAGELQSASAPPGMPGYYHSSIVLSQKTDRPSSPSFDQGPFRVRLTGLYYQRELLFSEGIATGMDRPSRTPARAGLIAPANAEDPICTEQFTVKLMVAAEPRLSLTQLGLLQLTEVRDDLGQSLLPTARPGAPIPNSAYLGLNSAQTLQFQASLTRPAHPGKRIKVLRGSVPVLVSSRKPDPITANLKSDMGKTVRNAEAALTIHSIKSLVQSRQEAIEVTLNAAASGTTSEVDPFGPRSPSESYHFEVIDEQERPIPWYVSGTSTVGEESRLILTTLPASATGSPAKLRYFSTTRKSTEIVFEFRNILMP